MGVRVTKPPLTTRTPEGVKAEAFAPSVPDPGRADG
jgi:hypothetical protein